ncbi:MAG TPA: tetratricopeptide repeat protein [Polyangiaceae bacterium]|nr:tetratricopeptide repeat protein [Polyangiaceae bacterium]
MRVLVVAMSLLGLATATGPVLAEPHVDAAATAEKLFQRGRSAARRGDWQRACEDFAASQELDPGAGTLLNWAMCEQALHKLASAWLHFNEAAQLLEPGDDRFPFVRAQLQKLSPRVPRLTLRLSPEMPAGAQVWRANSELAAASLGVALPVDPGSIELSVTCAGRETRRVFVALREAERLEITLEPGAPLRSSGTRPHTPPTNGAARSTHPGSVQKSLGLSLVAVGSVGIGLGLASGLVVAERQRTAVAHCPAHRCDASGFRAVESGERWLAVNTVSWSVGAAAVVSGAVLLVLSHDEQRDAAIQALPGGAAVVYGGRY